MVSSLLLIVSLCGVIAQSTRREKLRTVAAHAEAENWQQVALIYRQQSQDANVTAAIELKAAILDLVPKELRAKISDEAQVITRNSKEWPTLQSTVLDVQLATQLLNKGEYGMLRITLLPRLIENAEVDRSIVLRRIIVASGLMLLETDPSIPNCIAPWKGKIPFEQKAAVMRAILRLRFGTLVLKGANYCKQIGLKDDLCVRALVAAGAIRPDDLNALLPGDQKGSERALLEGCLLLKQRDTKKAAKHYTSIIPNLKEGSHEYSIAKAASKSLSPLVQWSSGAKEARRICGLSNMPLPLFRLLKSLDSMSASEKKELQASELLFWALMAAQYKEKAQTQLEKLNTLLGRHMKNLKGTSQRKANKELAFMQKTWDQTPLTDLSHISDHLSHLHKIIEHCEKLDLALARKEYDQLEGSMAENSSIEMSELQPVVKFAAVIILAMEHSGMLRREALAPPAMTLDDWQLNWYLLQAVHSLTDPYSAHILLMDDEADSYKDRCFSKRLFVRILFFAGRFAELRELMQKHTEWSEESRTYFELAEFCQLRPANICEYRQIEEHLAETSEIAEDLCHMWHEAEKASAFTDSVFTQAVGEQSSTLMLRPLLPGQENTAPKPLHELYRLNWIQPTASFYSITSRRQMRSHLNMVDVSITMQPPEKEKKTRRFIKRG